MSKAADNGRAAARDGGPQDRRPSAMTERHGEWMERRTLAFQHATSGKGKPTTYGASGSRKDRA